MPPGVQWKYGLADLAGRALVFGRPGKRREVRTKGRHVAKGPSLSHERREGRPEVALSCGVYAPASRGSETFRLEGCAAPLVLVAPTRQTPAAQRWILDQSVPSSSLLTRLRGSAASINTKPRSGGRGLALWWRQVIESCYHQGSESGVSVCRILVPALGVVSGKLQDF